MRAVVYCRTSTLEQAREEKVSIPDQVNWAKAFALERGWEWVNEYIEPGVTGDTEPEQRYALSRLLQHAREGLFDIVLIYHSSRLAREPDIGLRVCRLLGQNRIQIYFRNAPIEPVQSGKFSWGQNIGAQYMTAFSFIGDFQENVARSERVRSGFRGLAQRGVLVFAPYGYKKIYVLKANFPTHMVAWKFEPDPITSLIVRRIFTDYVTTGGSIRKIMLALNKERVPSPSGKVSVSAWSAPTIRNILRNPAYISKVQWGRKLGGKYLQGKSIDGKQRRIFADKQNIILVDGTHPAIVSGFSFEASRVKLKLRGEIKGRAVASLGLFTGLIRCGRCGKNAYYKRRFVKRHGKDRFDYVCSSYFTSKTCQRHVMSAPKLHQAVLGELNKLASNPDFRKKLILSSQKYKKEFDKNELVQIEKVLFDLNTRQRRILTAYEEGVLTLEQFGEAKGQLDETELSLHSRLDELNGQIINTELIKARARSFIKDLQDFNKTFSACDISQQKQIVASLVERVVVTENKIKIFYRF